LRTLDLSYLNGTLYPELIGLVSGILAVRGMRGKW